MAGGIEIEGSVFPQDILSVPPFFTIRRTFVKDTQSLGEYRAVEAIDVLVKFIYFPRHDDAGQVVYQPRGELRHAPPPAYHALVQIGEPSVPRIIDALRKDKDRRLTPQYLAVLKGIHGEDGVVPVLNRGIEASEDLTEVERLRSAIEAYKKDKYIIWPYKPRP